MNIQWWCAAQNAPWSWTWQPYPGVWFAVILLAFLYHRYAEKHRLEKPARIRAYAGIAVIWLAVDWPLGTLGAGYLASVHNAKFILLSFIGAPLIVSGCLKPGNADLSKPGRPGIALLTGIFFNIVLITTHVPAVVDALMPTQFGSFLNDALWVVAGAALWWPAASQQVIRHPLAKIVYVYLGSLSHTFLGIFLLLNKLPLYEVYELAPRVGGFSARGDQGLGGAIMLLLGNTIVFGTIAALFVFWYRSENERTKPVPRVAH